MKNLIAERIMHEGIRRIALRFRYDSELISLTKKLAGARWSQSNRCWHIPDSSDAVKDIANIFSGKANVDFTLLELNLAEKINLIRIGEESKSRIKKAVTKGELSLSAKGTEDIRKYRIWMESNRYPESTIRTYIAMMAKYLSFVSPREAADCRGEDLIRLIDEYILPNGLSQSYQNQMISSVKKFYTHIYNKAIDPVKITRPRPRHRLPNVLSKVEVKKILDVLSNEKHRVMLSLIYGCGLRRSELLNLKPSDVERNRNLLKIIQAKGFKDRVVPVSNRTIEMIDEYVKHYRPKKFLFEGQLPGEPYSASSIEKVLKNACEKARIGKPVTLHWLRHSYATHLLESGTDLRYIQELLGHRSSKTTEIYTHVTTKSIQNIRSPIDDL